MPLSPLVCLHHTTTPAPHPTVRNTYSPSKREGVASLNEFTMQHTQPTQHNRSLCTLVIFAPSLLCSLSVMLPLIPHTFQHSTPHNLITAREAVVVQIITVAHGSIPSLPSTTVHFIPSISLCPSSARVFYILRQGQHTLMHSPRYPQAPGVHDDADDDG